METPVTTKTTRASSGRAAQIRRRYETSKVPFVSTARVREDVLSLLEERKAMRRAAEALLQAAMPYTGDQGVKQAAEELREVLEGRKR